MARRGRKRKIGPREKNGRSSRQKAITTRQVAEAVVLAQPHRRGSTDQRCATVFGRFCMRNKLRGELYDAGEEYADVVRRWRAAKGVPSPYHNGGLGAGAGPADETVHKWAAQMVDLERAMMEGGIKELLAVRQLLLDGFDLGMDQEHYAVRGLMALAIKIGTMRADMHPFANAA